MARKSVIEKVNSMSGRVNPRYDLMSSEMVELHDGSKGLFDLIANSFNYGYMQGMKAAKAEMKKKGGGSAVSKA